MKPCLFLLSGFVLAVAQPTGAQSGPPPETVPRIAPAIPVPEPGSPPEIAPATPDAPMEKPDSPAVEAVPAPDARDDVGAPAGKSGPISEPAATAGPSPAPGKDGPRQPDLPANPIPSGKPLEWEQNIVRVSILDDMRPISIPVEGKEAMDRPARGGNVPTIVSPYPPKALSPVPEGWQLFTDTTVPTRIHRVKLKDGRTIDIGVFPPALMPANPEAATLVLPKSAGNPLDSISAARRSQEDSRAKIEMLLDALNRQLPAPESEPVPVP